MATQSLAFGYTTGQTLTAQLFVIGSDTVAATASSVTEATIRKGRYVAVFTDVAAGDYLLVYFLGGSGAGSEKYTLTLTTATFEPWAELKPGDATAANQTAILAAVAGVVLIGAGSQEKELTIRVAGVPVDGAAVWVTTDIGGENIVAGSRFTDAFGVVKFMLDIGDYYAWCQKSGLNFPNPTAFEVT